MRKVEYLRAFTNHRWDTVVVEVPSIEEDPDNGVDFEQTDIVGSELLDYAHRVLGNDIAHKDVVLFAVYNEDVGQ